MTADPRAAALRAYPPESGWDDQGPDGAVYCSWTDLEGHEQGEEPEPICAERAAYSLRLRDERMHPADRRYFPAPWVALCGAHTDAARRYWPDVERVRDARRDGEELS